MCNKTAFVVGFSGPVVRTSRQHPPPVPTHRRAKPVVRPRRLLHVVHGQTLVHVRPAAAVGELGGRVTVAAQYPLGGQQSFDADGAACVYPGRADAHLGACAGRTKKSFGFGKNNRLFEPVGPGTRKFRDDHSKTDTRTVTVFYFVFTPKSHTIGAIWRGGRLWMLITG